MPDTVCVRATNCASAGPRFWMSVTAASTEDVSAVVVAPRAVIASVRSDRALMISFCLSIACCSLFACLTCHATNDVRIRMQDLPNLNKPKDAQAAYTSWPAYRVSQGLTRTFQWRLNDCFRQQRFPEPKFASEVTVDLSMFLAVSANGAEYAGPGLKR